MRAVWLVVVAAMVLAACGGGGDGNKEPPTQPAAAIRSSVGPGDTERFLPMGVGDTWIFDVAVSSAGVPSGAYSHTLSVVHSAMEGDLIRVLMRDDTSTGWNPGGVREYFADRGGMTFVSATASSGLLSDALLKQIGAYRQMLFPIEPASFVSFDRRGLSMGEDIDGDGRFETVDARMTTTMTGFASVTVQAGSFARAAQFRHDLWMTVKSSSDGHRLPVNVTVTSWYVPGVGPVKSVTRLYARADGMEALDLTTTEELRTYRINGVTSGVPDASLFLPAGDGASVGAELVGGSLHVGTAGLSMQLAKPTPEPAAVTP